MTDMYNITACDIFEGNISETAIEVATNNKKLLSQQVLAEHYEVIFHKTFLL